MKKIKKIWKYYPLYVMLLPGLLLLVLMRYLPMFGVIIAFKDLNYADGIIGSPWNGLKNFEFLFRTKDVWVATRNTILYNLVFIVLGTSLAITFAIMLKEIHNKRMAKFYQSVMFFPYFLSMVVISYIVFAYLGMENGFINSGILAPLGAEKIKFYVDAKYWPFILTFVHIWRGIGYSTIIYMAAILGISPALYESAAIDGATKWMQIRHITLPLLRPVVIIMTILAIGKIFYSDFGLFYNVTMNSGPLYSTTQVIDTYVYRGMMHLGDLGMASAASLYQSFIGFLLVIISNWTVSRLDPDNAMF